MLDHSSSFIGCVRDAASARVATRKKTMPVDTPVSWEQARAYIDEGTVESLAKLGRNEAQLAEYRSAMDEVC